MLTDFNDDLDLEKIADSGQCFRWKRISGGEDPAAYRIISGGRVVFMRCLSEGEEGKRLELSCDEKEYEEYWKDYLDAATVYRDIRSLIDEKKDPHLFRAATLGEGLRILKQDPFETLISFIISQRKSIPAITTSVEKLSKTAGKRIPLSEDEKRWLKERGCEEESECHSFPSPERIASLTEEELKSCGFGYRTPYIRQASLDVISGKLDLEGLSEKGDEELFTELLSIYGVGKKVASCVCLFGFHRLDFFPVDVWMERVLKTHYKKGFPFKKYRPYNGVMQQYLFYGARIFDSRSL